jgi:hypothetical protein
MAGFYAGLNAQIPEHAMFQPGSYAVPYRPAQVPAPAVAHENEATEDDSTTEWEKKFSPQTGEPSSVALLPPPYEVPHLTFVYNHWTGRFHITPYEPGYAANPSAFPKQTSPRHIWVSSRAAAANPQPQVPYMSYYDPDPVILPAEIRLRGSRFSGPFTQLQPVPLPVPKPETARPVNPPPRSRLGARLQQNFGAFTAQ